VAVFVGRLGVVGGGWGLGHGLSLAPCSWSVRGRSRPRGVVAACSVYRLVWRESEVGWMGWREARLSGMTETFLFDQSLNP
jgi:hypothetical protein